MELTYATDFDQRLRHTSHAGGLSGARSVATDGELTAPGMSSYAWQLDDAQIAAVLT